MLKEGYGAHVGRLTRRRSAARAKPRVFRNTGTTGLACPSRDRCWGLEQIYDLILKVCLLREVFIVVMQERVEPIDPKKTRGDR